MCFAQIQCQGWAALQPTNKAIRRKGRLTCSWRRGSSCSKPPSRSEVSVLLVRATSTRFCPANSAATRARLVLPSVSPKTAAQKYSAVRETICCTGLLLGQRSVLYMLRQCWTHLSLKAQPGCTTRTAACTVPALPGLLPDHSAAAAALRRSFLQPHTGCPHRCSSGTLTEAMMLMQHV